MARLLGEAGAASVVDVGCGDGRLVEYLATKVFFPHPMFHMYSTHTACHHITI